MQSDIEIAQAAQPQRIDAIAEKAGIDDKYLEMYGKYKAKVDYNLLRDNEHTPGKLEEDIKKGDKLLMGGVKYTVEKVGDAANDNIRDEGHCTIVFNATGSMPGQIIVKGPAQPTLSVGAHITFTKK